MAAAAGLGRGLGCKLWTDGSAYHPSTRLSVAVCPGASPVLRQLTVTEPDPLHNCVKAFAPATVANLGPGFDFLGCAVDQLGDLVTVKVSQQVRPGEVVISSVSGDGGKLSLSSEENCAGIAAKATLQLLGARSVGLSLSLHKGLPLGSGLGSSAASAAAAAVAVNGVFGSPLTKAQLVLAGLQSEAKVSGYHADNVAPCLMGGFVLVRSYRPLQLVPLEFPKNRSLFFVIVTPDFEAPTQQMRAVLPTTVSMEQHVETCSQAAALTTAIVQGDIALLGSALSSDCLVVPRRAPLIPGMQAVIDAALASNAYGCTISGAGPTAVAITDSEDKGAEIKNRMVDGFGRLKVSAAIHRLDREGARVVEVS